MKVAHPFAVVEDILARLTILNNELDQHLGPPPAHTRHRSDAAVAAFQVAAHIT